MPLNDNVRLCRKDNSVRRRNYWPPLKLFFWSQNFWFLPQVTTTAKLFLEAPVNREAKATGGRCQKKFWEQKELGASTPQLAVKILPPAARKNEDKVQNFY